MIADKLGRKPSSVKDRYREILLVENRVAGKHAAEFQKLVLPGSGSSKIEVHPSQSISARELAVMRVHLRNLTFCAANAICPACTG
jgi:hypothetical protein